VQNISFTLYYVICLQNVHTVRCYIDVLDALHMLKKKKSVT